MKFEHCFSVKAPVSEVTDFHRHASGLRALTPPFALMRFHRLPDPIQQGDVLSFSMWLGPVPIYWESCFPEVAANGFVDTQGKGPFRSWVHRHTFTEASPGITEVHDQIEAHLHSNLWRAFVGLLMWGSLAILFRYRQRQTRRILEKRAKATQVSPS